jgi:hypothetical protein
MTAADSPAARDGVSFIGGAATTVPDGSVLQAVVQPQCSLAVQLRRVTGSVVGRPLELAAIQQELTAARSQLSAVTLEGEPGIGKTRLLVATSEIAQTAGFVPVAVTADEEIRGPFLVAQSLFAAPALRAGTSRASRRSRRTASSFERSISPPSPSAPRPPSVPSRC